MRTSGCCLAAAACGLATRRDAGTGLRRLAVVIVRSGRDIDDAPPAPGVFVRLLAAVMLAIGPAALALNAAWFAYLRGSHRVRAVWPEARGTLL